MEYVHTSDSSTCAGRFRFTGGWDVGMTSSSESEQLKSSADSFDCEATDVFDFLGARFFAVSDFFLSATFFEVDGACCWADDDCEDRMVVGDSSIVLKESSSSSSQNGLRDQPGLDKKKNILNTLTKRKTSKSTD